VINRLLEVFLGHDATAWPLQKKLPLVVQALREQPLLVVWDNFESAAGIEGTEVTPLLPQSDRLVLHDLLRQLRGGRSKILITSRSSEDWLTPLEAFRLPLRGLRGEDAWTYCNAVVRDLGLQIDRADPDCRELLNELDGHPLALRSILLQLAQMPARELLDRLKRQFAGQQGDESTRRIFAALALLNQRLPREWGPILQLIGLHQRYVDIDYVANMMRVADESSERQTLNQCFGTLERGGLLHHAGSGVYSMHPALRGFLATAYPAEEECVERFVDFMASYADALASKQLHEQRGPFDVHGANFRYALTRASQVNEMCALTQSLAAYAQNCRDFKSATDLFEQLAQARLRVEDSSGAASAHHQLGMIAQEQRDFEAAERWYLKSLAIEEKHGNEHGAAGTYHQLGIIAEEQRDFETAERWHLKSLAIKEKQGNEHGAAITYHQLGRIAEEQHEFETAERWYLKSLAIKEKQGNEHGAAITYHQLGMIAEEQQDFATAGEFTLKAIIIYIKFKDHHLRQISIATFLRCLAAANARTQKALREHWQTVGLSEQFNLTDLEKQFREQAK
jgi:tetratricopeptide (TPR) repeat protein